MNGDVTPVGPDEEAEVRAFLRSEPRPAVDELTRQRVVRGAVAGARETRPGISRRVLTAVGVAAVAAAVAATLLVVRTDNGEPRLAALSRETVVATWAGDLGAADRDAIAGALARPETAPLRANASMPDAVIRCAAESAHDRELEESFAVTLEPEGVAAFALRYDEPGPDVGLVVAASDCRLLDRFDIPDATR